MKQTHYFTVNFTGFTTAASEEQSYLRLIAGEHAFYTDKRHFKDPSLFDRLRLGQPLHIGTCRLKDGSYWIHWLSDGHILLEPSRQPLSIKKLLRPVGLVFFVCLIILACAPWLDIFLLLCFITMLVNPFGIFSFSLAISHSGYVFSMRKCSERSKAIFHSVSVWKFYPLLLKGIHHRPTTR
ncbi:TPA: hypothetical protein L9M12_003098 [Klebsiella pneumoniae]|nr:hypothetical protein [Klebsiella pneumoniae]